MADTKKVSPAPTYAEYVNENLGVYEVDFDNGSDCCAEFTGNENQAEGVSGLKKVDTTYENYSESVVTRPRSDWDDDISLRGKSVKDSTVRHPAPYPMDLWRYPHRRT